MRPFKHDGRIKKLNLLNKHFMTFNKYSHILQQIISNKKNYNKTLYETQAYHIYMFSILQSTAC